MSQEECAILRESVPYVKLYRYNPKHLYPKLNGYGDNGQRKCHLLAGSTYCTWPAVPSALPDTHNQGRVCFAASRDEAGRYAVALAPIDVHERQSAK